MSYFKEERERREALRKEKELEASRDLEARAKIAIEIEGNITEDLSTFLAGGSVTSNGDLVNVTKGNQTMNIRCLAADRFAISQGTNIRTDLSKKDLATEVFNFLDVPI